MCEYIRFNVTHERRTSPMVKNKLSRFEYWLEVMRRRVVASSTTAPVAFLYSLRASVAIKMRVVPA